MKNQGNRFKKQKKQVLRFGSMLLVGAILGSTTSAQMVSDAGDWKADTEARATNARELLGRSYKRSAANVGGKWEAGLGLFVYSHTRELLPPAFKRSAGAVVHAILEESRRYQFDPVLAMAVIAHESRFNPAARGGHGEIGLMQIKPDTAAWIARKASLPFTDIKTQLTDPVFNIRVGMAYLSMLRQHFAAHGSYYLAAYNMGTHKLMSTVREAGLPRLYASKVMKQYLNFYGTYRTRLAENF